jgi:hypothetical protein
MRKEIRIVDEKRSILQCTTVDERWYIRQATDAAGLPTYDFVPSVTWIAEFYPKGIAFYKWLADKGWDEAEALKTAAGDKGSKVHLAICELIDGKEVKIESQYINKTTEQPEELTLQEYECLMAFTEWFKINKPEIINREFVVWNDEEKYAGTIDIICKIKDETWIIDIKTGQYIWPSHELQISAYKYASKINARLAILQLGYYRNKNKFKFTEIDDQYDLFLTAKKIWAKETKDIAPLQRDYPLVLKLV